MNISGRIFKIITEFDPFSSYKSMRLPARPFKPLDGVDTVESMKADRDYYKDMADEYVKMSKKQDQLMAEMKHRVLYLTVLFAAIEESPIANGLWEDLLLTLKLTCPDRDELMAKLRFMPPEEVIAILSPDELK